jgi:hypothetical protein
MTAESATTSTETSSTETSTSTASLAASAAVPAPPSWPWLRGALILAGAAQLITISALVSADPLAVTWSSLLLAIAPAPLVAAAAFTPAPAKRLAVAVAEVILIVGIVGGITHTGLFFVPALAVLAVAAAKLWGERG